MRSQDLQEPLAGGHASIWNWKRFSLVFLRLFLGGIFVYAGFDKIPRPSDFAEVIFNYQVLPEVLINLASVVLPWLEAFLGLSLIFGFWLPGAVLICNSLLLVFFATLIFNLARGLDIDCGCFSVSSTASSGGHMLWYLLRDSFFLLIGLCLFISLFFQRRSKTYAVESGERSAIAQTWRTALRQAASIAIVPLVLGLVSNQLRSNSLPLFGQWPSEARLALKFGKNILIPFDEAKEKYFAGKAYFVDARPENDYRRGHIKGAHNLPFEAFDQKAADVLMDLPEDALIITYCDGERCTLSAEVAHKLKEIGYENVRVLFNGWAVWKEHRLPTQAAEERGS